MLPLYETTLFTGYASPPIPPAFQTPSQYKPIPDKPERPDVPESPEIPDAPLRPDIPEVPLKPEIPDKPEIPLKPLRPETDILAHLNKALGVEFVLLFSKEI